MKVFVKIGINESGIDEGEMDFSTGSNLFNASLENRIEIKRIFERLSFENEEKIAKLGGKTSFTFKVRKLVNIKGIYKSVTRKDHVMWPISFKWSEYSSAFARTSFISAHGWQIGWKNGKRLYGWTLGIGRLLILFGKRMK
ncbi:hypothetical protein [Kangiella sp.]|uniref:hypothetical protein n=1 Tax=Kangiella sp. TaxID=1920245 RepID=UPI003A8FBA57